MSKQHLRAFEEEDLHKHFEKYCTDKFVQRFLRNNGISTVGDLLSLDEEIELEIFLDDNSGNHKTLERSLYLYRKLKKHRNKIIAAHAPIPPPKNDDATPPQESQTISKSSDSHDNTDKSLQPTTTTENTKKETPDTDPRHGIEGFRGSA